MPEKPSKPCAMFGCPRLTKNKYCAEHTEVEKEDKATRQKYYDMYARDKKSRQFYNSKEWKSVRDQARRRSNNLCEMCYKDKIIRVADICDHIVPIKVDWSKRLLLENLQLLCHQHHNEKTAEDKVKYGI